VAAQVEVEHVEARRREVVGEAARGQVPRVAVLAEAVDQQHGGVRPLAGREALAHHGERDGAVRHHDLLAERPDVTAVDDLIDDSPVKDHVNIGVGVDVAPPPTSGRG
jgi:hypothetical protein